MKLIDVVAAVLVAVGEGSRAETGSVPAEPAAQDGDHVIPARHGQAA